LPFYVWSEFAQGEGVEHFITGAGGFLQQFVFGYLGLEYNDRSCKLHPRLPPGSNTMSFPQIALLGATFYVQVTPTVTFLEVLNASPDILCLEQNYGESRIIQANELYELDTNVQVTIEYCAR
jgi:trehalose/maltose hydrolase-like predicted phosphorylase